MLNLVSSIINTSFFQPPSMTPTTTPHHHHPLITTVPKSHSCSQPPLTAYNHGTQPQKAMWQCHITSHNNHKDQQPQMMKNTQTTKKAQTWTWMTPPLTNDGQHLRTDTDDNEPRWDSLPPPIHFSDIKSRCHIAISDMATRQQTTSSFVIVARTPWWAPLIPHSSQPTLLRHSDTECNCTLLKMRILAFLPINPCSST